MALVKIAEMYEKGDELPKDMAEALKWYRVSAESGNLEASFRVAALLLNAKKGPTPDEYKEARRRCEDAATRYSPGAYCMALIYKDGLGVTRDLEESARWLSRATELGNAKAALQLGEAYWKGDGVKPDLVTAYMWIWLASNSKVEGADADEQGLLKEMSAKQVEQAKRKAQDWGKQHHLLGLRQPQAPSAPAPQ
jgi:TPR repeat protein